VNKTRVAVGAGAMTMVALCFANGLQQGIDQSQSQAIESLKASFHVSDLQIGLIRVATGPAGALGALLIARLCRDRARTLVLSGMFATWSVLMFVTGFVSVFPLFVLMRALTAPTEATDPAALPLLADWWPARTASREGQHLPGGCGVGAIFGIAGPASSSIATDGSPRSGCGSPSGSSARSSSARSASLGAARRTSRSATRSRRSKPTHSSNTRPRSPSSLVSP